MPQTGWSVRYSQYNPEYRRKSCSGTISLFRQDNIALDLWIISPDSTGVQLQIFEWSGKNNVQEFACHGFFNIFQYLFACSENISAVDIPDDRKESPSLVVPVISSSPKLETPAVVLAAYLPRFDYRSAVTMFGTQALYTTTHSRPGRLFTKAYFREDKHRLFTIAGGGKIRNDCENYLNTGHPVQDNDESRVLFGQESRVR